MRTHRDNLNCDCSFHGEARLGHRVSHPGGLFSCRETEPLDGFGRLAESRTQNAAGARPRAKLCRTEGGTNAVSSTKSACLTRSAQNVRLCRDNPPQIVDAEIQVARCHRPGGCGPNRGTSWSSFRI